ncbi:MAG: group III truncated hemoglobin [Reyranella sp.]|nr:group III truncated hemoglobin [Reyranella sp.]MDP3159581.1 group III truncated hemoglobin [Reyranella sp.]
MSIESLDSTERRARITADIVERTGIDAAMIQRLVTAFYARVREDALLGPVFGAHVVDWDAHLARMCSFWASVALMSGSYHGNPMGRHIGLPIDARHFDRWLALFEETAAEVCPPPAADHFIERARRIAQSLELGIASVRGVRLGRGQRFHREDLTPPSPGDQP